MEKVEAIILAALLSILPSFAQRTEPVPFGDFEQWTRRPSALIMDCQAELPNTGMLVRGTTFSHKEFPGEDPCQIVLLLQRRWEEADGSIHAQRVGTAGCRIEQSTDGWCKDFRIPVIYGDARKSASFRSYMDLSQTFYAVNSRGECKPIQENGWADEDAPVTHAVLMISAGSCEAFVGALGNTLYVDNIRLEYDN